MTDASGVVWARADRPSSGAMTVTLRDIDGRASYSVELDPEG